MKQSKYNTLKERLISCGKTKATILYIVLCLSALIVLTVLHSLVIYNNLHGSFTHNTGFLIYATIIILISSASFYNDAIAESKKNDDLKKRGLTPADISNMKFVQEWKQKKDNGLLKYILFNGGIFLGSLIFLFISFSFFPKAAPEGRQFPEFSDMINYMVKCYGVGFFTGMLLSAINWIFNERKFKRLNAAQFMG
ncbi:hypothetical protein ACFQZX_05165 [Mucilaginibacter litoreus]|uniref:Uncharacterized protein n=1 Tax=Mucilaginibacter litoreus TaxID=1048221 RepID=A0ABW3AR81_9SPHI